MFACERSIQFVASSLLHVGVVYPWESRVWLLCPANHLIGIFQSVLSIAHPEVCTCQHGGACKEIELVAWQIVCFLSIIVVGVQRVIGQFVVSYEQVVDHHLHGFVHRLLSDDIGRILSHVGNTLGIAVHRWQFEVQEATKSVCLASIDVVVVVQEHVLVSLLDILNQDVGIGNTIVCLAPDCRNDALVVSLCIVEFVGIAPFSIGVDVVAMRQHLHKSNAHVQSIHILRCHGGINTRQLVFVSTHTVEMVFFLDL